MSLTPSRVFNRLYCPRSSHNYVPLSLQSFHLPRCESIQNSNMSLYFSIVLKYGSSELSYTPISPHSSHNYVLIRTSPDFWYVPLSLQSSRMFLYEFLQNSHVLESPQSFHNYMPMRIYIQSSRNYVPVATLIFICVNISPDTRFSKSHNYVRIIKTIYEQPPKRQSRRCPLIFARH